MALFLVVFSSSPIPQIPLIPPRIRHALHKADAAQEQQRPRHCGMAPSGALQDLSRGPVFSFAAEILQYGHARPCFHQHAGKRVMFPRASGLPANCPGGGCELGRKAAGIDLHRQAHSPVTRTNSAPPGTVGPRWMVSMSIWLSSFQTPACVMASRVTFSMLSRSRLE